MAHLPCQTSKSAGAGYAERVCILRPDFLGSFIEEIWN
jgi:hypothetical protein